MSKLKLPQRKKKAGKGGFRRKLSGLIDNFLSAARNNPLFGSPELAPVRIPAEAKQGKVIRRKPRNPWD